MTRRNEPWILTSSMRPVRCLCGKTAIANRGRDPRTDIKYGSSGKDWRARSANDKIQAGNEEDPDGEERDGRAHDSEDTKSWLLIPVRCQEQLTQCCTLGWRGGAARPLRNPGGAWPLSCQRAGGLGPAEPPCQRGWGWLRSTASTAGRMSSAKLDGRPVTAVARAPWRGPDTRLPAAVAWPSRWPTRSWSCRWYRGPRRLPPGGNSPRAWRSHIRFAQSPVNGHWAQSGSVGRHQSWPIRHAGQSSSPGNSGFRRRAVPLRLFRGVVVDNPKTSEHAHQVDVRLNVDLPLLPSEAAEVVAEYPSRHRRDPGPDPVDFL